MTDKENIQLEKFFKHAAQQQIEDNGFTVRVMGTLEDEAYGSLGHQTSKRLCRLWTVFCVIVAAALFFILNGWDVLRGSIQTFFLTIVTNVEVFLTTVPTVDLHLNPVLVLLLAVFVSVYIPYQTARRLSAVL